MDVLLSKILSESRMPFYRFSNADGKEWFVPEYGTSVGLALYQASNRNGLLLKKLLPILGHVGLFRRLVHIEMRNIELVESLRTEICLAFGVDEFRFSVFGGTPCVHQKITIQIFTIEGKILGYCKVAGNPDVWSNFKREYKLLGDLHHQGVKGVPEGLLCEKINKGCYVFAKSTVKSLKTQYPHQWSDLHAQFLADMQRKTIRHLPYEQTDFCNQLTALGTRIDWLNPNIIEIVKRGLDCVKQKYEGKEVEFSLFHADFTPWNMFVEQGQLFVFDWEYAIRTCPPGLDRYHFFTQTEIFEHHHQVDQIWESFQKTGMDKETYLEYLLLVMAIYTGRETSESVNLIHEELVRWSSLIKKIISAIN